MRFKITLVRTSSENLLPASYQYELSAWIYKILDRADEAYSLFLHDKGYQLPDSNKNFKMFCFSNLFIRPFSMLDNRIRIEGTRLHLYISFYMDKAAEHFIMGLFREQEFRLGDRLSQVNLRVENIEAEQVPTPLDSTALWVKSPLMVGRKKSDGNDDYLAPTDTDFETLLIQNLMDKYRSVHQQVPAEWQQAHFKVEVSETERMKAKLITVKADTPQQTRIRGYENFKIRLIAPKELIEIALAAGLGRENAMGFGFCEVAKGQNN